MTRSELAPLRCGSDLYTRLSSDELRSRLSKAAIRAIEDGLAEPRDRDRAMRWVCRGLSPEDAIAKVVIDLEVRDFYERRHKARAAGRGRQD